MSSIFSEDSVDDLFNDNLESNELPGSDEEPLCVDLFPDEGAEPSSENGIAVLVKSVEPKKRAVRNPRPRLTIDTLSGPRGIHTIENYYKDIKFKGKGYERHDLDEIMRRLQHWGHRMYPSYKFDDILTNIERLGKKKPLHVHMSRYRLGMLENFATNTALVEDGNNEADDDAINVAAIAVDEPYDEFDALLGEQIAMSKLDPRTPARNNRLQQTNNNLATNTSTVSSLTTPSFMRSALMSTPYTGKNGNMNDTKEYAQSLPSSHPKRLSSEQIARIAENRRLAQERLRAKQQQQQQGLLKTN